jgi:hypothetical protein
LATSQHLELVAVAAVVAKKLVEEVAKDCGATYCCCPRRMCLIQQANMTQLEAAVEPTMSLRPELQILQLLDRYRSLQKPL